MLRLNQLNRCFAALSVLGAFFLLGASSWAEAGKARVTHASGQASAFLPGSSKAVPIKAGDIYPAGTRIETGKGAFVGLAFSSGGGLALGPSSKLSLVSLSHEKSASRSGLLDLEAGRAVAYMDKSGGTTDFKIKTPYGTSAVHGTVWNLDLVLGRLDVVNGRVVFTTPSGAVFDLGPLQGLNLKEGKLEQIDVSRETLQDIIRFLKGAGFDVEEIIEGSLRSLVIKPQVAQFGFTDTRQIPGDGEEGNNGGANGGGNGRRPVVSPSSP